MLVAARDERAGDAVLAALAERTHADRQVVVGHERVFDVATFEVTLPAASTAAVAAWLAARFPAAAAPVSLTARECVVVGRGAGGEPVRERLVRLGPHRLVGIVTEPAGAEDVV